MNQKKKSRALRTLSRASRRAFLLAEAYLKLDASKRSGFLEEACGDDAELLVETREILENCRRADRFLESPFLYKVSELAMQSISQQEHPRRIDAYEIVKPLGEGGMGVVYLARQTEPVKRQVALKMIKWGLPEEFLFRFAAEYQVLAQMEHPNLARVIDAGRWEKRPYFTMEYFPGRPIHDFCREHRLNLRQRLDLMLQACDGVGHAHRNGIIHRDIKPGNILVDALQEKHVVKVIDFGIAKALDRSQWLDVGFQTGGYRILGTPAYMSPEQINPRGAKADTRTDVYGLGAVLYELLAGSAPLDSRKLQDADLREVIHMIQDEEPSMPSIRRASETEDEGAVTVKEIRGDLDWIALKALAKNPQDRYDSVRDLAGDIRRHLCCLPVAAGPPAWTYKLGKFLRRHRHALLPTFAVIVALGFLLHAQFRAGIARATALKLEYQLTAIEDLLGQSLDLPNPYRNVPYPLNPDEKTSLSPDMETFLGHLGEQAEAKLKAYPLKEARIQAALARNFSSIGRFERAQDHLERALFLRRALGKRHPETLALRERQAFYLYQMGRYGDSERAFRELLPVQREVLGEDHALYLKTRRGFANLRLDRGRAEEAVAHYREVLSGQQRILGPRHTETWVTHLVLGNALRAAGDHAGAEANYREAWEGLREKLGPDHPHTLAAQFNLAILLQDRGEYEQAAAQLRRVIEARTRVLGATHAETLLASNSLGHNHYIRGRYLQAETILTRTHNLQAEILGNDHIDTQYTLNNLAITLAAMGRLEEAADHLHELAAIRAGRWGPAHPDTLLTVNNLAYTMLQMEHFAEAENILREAHSLGRETHGAGHRRSLLLQATLAEVLMAQGKHPEAQPLLEHLVQHAPAAYPPGHDSPILFQGLLGQNLLKLGRHAEAEYHLLESHRLLEDRQPHYRQQLHQSILALYQQWCPEQETPWRHETLNLTEADP